MRTVKTLLVLGIVASAFAVAFHEGLSRRADAAFSGYRQYYGSWSYYPTRSYYYRSYYYKPTVSYSGYKYHYAIYYPARPRYVYYYNPYNQYYWGRYDLESQGYSLLDEKDRKKNLEEIPDSAFPEPAEMPVIPEGSDNVRMQAIPQEDLPQSDPPQDAPVGA